MRWIDAGALLACCSVSALAAEPPASTLVFGLPLGGKLTPAPRVCTPAELRAEKIKALCWIDKPSVDKIDGSKYGHLHFPDPDQLPAWAAHAMVKASVAKDWVLESLRLTLQNNQFRREISQSITKRFGLPNANTLAEPGTAFAEWHSERIRIEEVCSYDLCNVSFMALEYLKWRDQGKDSAVQQKPVRPESP